MVKKKSVSTKTSENAAASPSPNDRLILKVERIDGTQKIITDIPVSDIIIPQNGEGGIDQQKALNYIKNSFSIEAGMVVESPSTPNQYWLWNDQLLAQMLLKHIDPQMAIVVETKMNSFNVAMKTPFATLQKKYRNNFSIKAVSEVTVQQSPHIIKYSDYSGTSDLGYEYADIAFLSAIHYFRQGNLAAARTAYNAGRQMWDGVGFKDKGSITGDYALYKSALGLLAEKVTGFDTIGIPKDYFKRFQNENNGGMTTDITGGQPSGSQNIETTCLVLFAENPSLLPPETIDPPVCPPDKEWSDQYQKCIPICKEGERYDPVTDSCVIIQPSEKFILGQIGDTHGMDGSGATGFRELVNKHKCNFIVHTGDITDTERDDDGYINLTKSLNLVYGKDFANSQGNHESREESGEGAEEDMENAFPTLKQNEWLQMYHIKNCVIIIGNTQAIGYSQTDSNAGKWLIDTLIKARQLVTSGQADWIFYFQHKPFWTMKAAHESLFNFRYNFHPLFDQYGVDICGHGHNHNMQRTMPILYVGASNTPPKVNPKMVGNAHDMSMLPHGIVVNINGTATKNSSFTENKNAWTVYAEDRGHAYCVYTIEGKKLNCKYISIGSGTILHEYNLTKEGSVPADEAVARLDLPSTAEPLQKNVRADASQSVADTVEITETTSENIQLRDAGQWVKEFDIPDKDNFSIGIQAVARKGNKQSVVQKAVQVRRQGPIEGDIDEFGQIWFHANGDQFLIKQSRDEEDDDRWSGNISGVRRGYESMMIAKSIGTNSSSHFASKIFGGNHSGSGASSQRWYDLGVRYDGRIQLQWEGVGHPDNHNFTLPDRCWLIKKLNRVLEAGYLGLKWFVYKLSGPDGSPANGGVLVKMWVNEDPIDEVTKKVKNENWKLALQFIDGVDVQVIDPQNYSAPDTCDIEIRRSDTKQHEVWGGGQHIRRLGTFTLKQEKKMIAEIMKSMDVKERDKINEENKRLAKEVISKCVAFDCPREGEEGDNIKMIKKGKKTPSSAAATD